MNILAYSTGYESQYFYILTVNKKMKPLKFNCSDNTDAMQVSKKNTMECVFKIDIHTLVLIN